MVTGIEEDVILTSKPEENMPVYVIPDEAERVRLNKISEKSSELTYPKKSADADTSVYNRVLNVMKKLDTSYSTKIHNIHDPFIEENY